jgi:hypothetical protein
MSRAGMHCCSRCILRPTKSERDSRVRRTHDSLGCPASYLVLQLDPSPTTKLVAALLEFDRQAPVVGPQAYVCMTDELTRHLVVYLLRAEAPAVMGSLPALSCIISLLHSESG